MNVYIDISKVRTDGCDWSVPCYGGTYMPFNKLPKKGDIIEHLHIIPAWKNNNKQLNNVPEGSFQVLCDPFPIEDTIFNCTHKILVCSSEL